MATVGAGLEERLSSVWRYLWTQYSPQLEIFFGSDYGTMRKQMQQQRDIKAAQEPEFMGGTIHGGLDPFPHLFHPQFLFFSLSTQIPCCCRCLFELTHFSVTLYVSSIIIFSPSLSRSTSLPPGSLLTISHQNYLSALCTCHQKCSPFPRHRTSRRAGEASLCACLRTDTQM